MSAFTNVQQVIQSFITEHPEELVNGKLKICIAGGAGFIGSHIAKCLKAEVCLYARCECNLFYSLENVDMIDGIIVLA
jgi:hypothetical protein